MTIELSEEEILVLSTAINCQIIWLRHTNVSKDKFLEDLKTKTEELSKKIRVIADTIEP